MTERKKEWFKDIRKEIEQLAKFHSIEVHMVYGDGEETTDEMVSLEELRRILSEIEYAINEDAGNVTSWQELVQEFKWMYERGERR